jgi:hypothetical protein
MVGYDHDNPFDEGYIQVSELHSVYYAQYGKKDGKPSKEPSCPTPRVKANEW